MKTKAGFIACLLCVCISVIAKHSDNFLLGNYSYWRTYGIHSSVADSVFQRMQDCGYNSTICNTYSNSIDTDDLLTNMLHIMDTYSLDAILTDYAWDAMQSSDKYGTRGFTLSNFQKYEAEFSDEDCVSTFDSTDDMFYYFSRIEEMSDTLRTGTAFQLSGKSNDNVWLCTPGNNPGYAYKNITYRWKEEGSNDYDKLTEELQFINMSWDSDLTDYMLNNTYLFFTFAFTIPDYNRDISHPINLVRFELCGYNWQGEFKKLNFINEHDGVCDELILEQYDFDDITRGDAWNNKLYTLKISLKTLNDNGFLSADGVFSGRRVISDINPRMYWYGNSTLQLDYIEVEDNVHKVMTSDASQFSDRLNQRISSLNAMSLGNLKYLYSFDEPNQAQFDSFKRVQDAIENNNPTIVTAVYDKQRDMIKDNSEADPLSKYYHHQRAFIEKASPEILSPDLYPVKPQTTWNLSSDSNFLQTNLERNLLVKYKDYKIEAEDNPNMKFIPVVQSFGAWSRSENPNQWSSWLRPPYETQKMLQLLPLCYGVDGIINYVYPTFNKSSYTSNDTMSYQYGALSIVQQGSSYNFVPLSNYYALKEANEKIHKYAGILNDSLTTWLGADSLMVTANNPNLPYSSMLLQSMQVQPSGGQYQGYVQCGAYMGVSSQPMFMLVNRRANYVREGYNPRYTENSTLDNCFEPALNQIVRTAPNEQAHALFGDFIALYDPYSQEIYPSTSQGIDVPIGPGDGKLLQMCSSLPPVVTGNSTVKNIAYLSGDISLETGANVTILPGTITKVFPQSTITVKSGAQLSIAGEVTIQDSVSIIVESGGSISFDEAVCTWGENSGIIVTDGDLTIQSSTFDKSASAANWKGIRVTGSDLVNISDATISNADKNMIVNANTIIHNCNFSVPADAWGLVLGNTVTGYQTEIVNTEQGFGFTGVSGLSSKGISLLRMENAVLINNVDFTNLLYGIHKSSYSTTMDTISVCSFHNCGTGIYLINKVSGATITQCSFVNNYEENTGTGIDLQASSPMVSSCSFIKLQRGIRTEFNLPGSMPVRSNITGSLFYKCESGIVSRNSNYRLEENYFNRNEVGIVNHAGSNLSLSYNANNVLMNSDANIEFYDTMPYESTIQLFNGHNDFYHLENSNAIDFCFDTNYYNFPRVPNHQINASRNWFDDNVFTVNDTLYLSNVLVASYDPTPSMPAPPPESDRLYTALGLEFEGSYDSAIVYYAAIIDDQLESEKSYVTSAIDGLYRCRILRSDPIWALSDYFSSQAVQYAIDEPELSAVFQDYLCKSLVLNNEFQAAVDLIQIRIDNPVSEIDSLRAVLDLEIVLQLAAMEESKRPIVTDYVQYKYPDLQVFKVMHDSTWDRYESLLDAKDEPSTIPISSMPLIKSNYPNPFNPSTTIEYSIPSAGKAKLCVYNIRGQKVKTLFDGTAEKGLHRLVWDGRDGSGRSVASGIYLIHLESSGKSSIRKAMLMK